MEKAFVWFYSSRCFRSTTRMPVSSWRGLGNNVEVEAVKAEGKTPVAPGMRGKVVEGKLRSDRKVKD